MREIRCSSLSRYMKCRGFAFMEDLRESEPHPVAKEGTACGELLQAMLEQRKLEPQVLAAASNGVNFDENMYFYTQIFAKKLLDYNVPITCEERVDWQAGRQTMIRGQYDAAYFLGDMLCIDDLKYGWGLVEVKPNWQLLGYAIGKYLKETAMGRPINSIRLRIYQPRPHHEDGDLREWLLTPSELQQFYSDIMTQVALIESGDDTLQTGSHCRYCMAAAEDCPAMNRAFYNAIDVTFKNFEQDRLTEDEISAQLKLIDRAQEILKIKSDSINALAITRLRQGSVIKGYSLEQSLGNREWKPGVSAKIIEEMTGFTAMEKVTLSPAKIEKLGIPKSFLDSMTKREMRAVKLVPKDGGSKGNDIFGKDAPK